jgi:hypothetical protein
MRIDTLFYILAMFSAHSKNLHRRVRLFQHVGQVCLVTLCMYGKPKSAFTFKISYECSILHFMLFVKLLLASFWLCLAKNAGTNGQSHKPSKSQRLTGVYRVI